MGWALVIGLAVAAFVALVAVFKAPRKGWEAIAATLIVGLAGFAFQARPNQPGAPKVAENQTRSGVALVEALHSFSRRGATSTDRLMVTADALTRNGNFADAAALALGVTEKDPRNADAWTAVGVNLVAHSDGVLTPAAQFAFRRAIEIDPGHGGPAFFTGLSLLQSGQFEQGRAQWASLLARAPSDAPWRAKVQAQLEELDAFLAERAKAGQ